MPPLTSYAQPLTPAQADQLRTLLDDRGFTFWDLLVIPPARYNELYAKIGNLNRLLAWGHARVLENLLGRRPDCPRALSDQFANKSLVQKALMERGKAVVLDQMTKAESDPAVAAASILAREAFVNWLRDHDDLPKGVSPAVKARARTIGSDALPGLAKMHFRTAAELG
ncbi:hypothetical protein BH23VER1_BH23VER1_08910 [soil metagenome]